MRKILFLLPVAILFLVGSCQTNTPESKAKYIFLFIGDGMGMNQAYATELYLAALDNKHGNEALSFSDFPVQSYVTTYSANSLITCSSAAITAIATGHKTNNGVLNKDTSLAIKYETIAEKAQKAGYKIGILSSVAIDHATPAGYYAHQDSRNMYYEISMEMPESGFDYFGGGGFHNPKGLNDSMPDAFENAVAKGYTIVNTKKGFDALKNGDKKVFAINPKTYPKGEFYWEIDKVDSSISLAEFTKKGIEVLENPKGFFMMVEGGKIDWACHSDDIATSIHETLAFDKAVAEAIKFYKKHPDNTLILVTADHETGGIGVGNDKPLRLGLLQHQKISAQEFGRRLTNFKQNNPKASFDDVMALVEKYFGLGNESKGLGLDDNELAFLHEAYVAEFINKTKVNPDKDYLEHFSDINITNRAIYLMSEKTGIGWTTFGHTGTPVPIRALGQGQEYFKSCIDNTDIPKIIEKLMDIQ